MVLVVELVKTVVGMTLNISKGIIVLFFLTSMLTAIVMGVPSLLWYLGVYPWVAFPAWWILMGGFLYEAKKEEIV